MANNKINSNENHLPIDRDERHPFMDPPIPSIDNNTLNNIINSIIQSNNKMNGLNSIESSPNTNGSTQYLLPVDLIVSIDNKSKLHTVQAALPSTFAIQPSLPIIQQPLIPNIPSLTNTIPNIQMPTYNITNNTINNNIIINKSSLNPSAPSFTPSFTQSMSYNNTMQPIAETEHEINGIINNRNKLPVNDENVKDEWCMYDDNDTQKQQQHPVQKQQQNYTAKKEIIKPKIWNTFHKDERPYNKPWRKTRFGKEPWRHNHRFGNNKIIKLLAVFVKHVTLPNRHSYPPDTLLTKTWAMKNCGETEWGYGVELVYCKGDENLCLHKRYPVKNAAQGEEIEISANIKTPTKLGRYCTYFRLQKHGKFFGPRVWVDIIVKSLDEMDNNSTNNCGTENIKNINDAQQKAIKWKKKYNARNGGHNHYKVVSCK